MLSTIPRQEYYKFGNKSLCNLSLLNKEFANLTKAERAFRECAKQLEEIAKSLSFIREGYNKIAGNNYFASIFRLELYPNFIYAVDFKTPSFNNKADEITFKNTLEELNRICSVLSLSRVKILITNNLIKSYNDILFTPNKKRLLEGLNLLIKFYDDFKPISNEELELTPEALKYMPRGNSYIMLYFKDKTNEIRIDSRHDDFVPAMLKSKKITFSNDHETLAFLYSIKNNPVNEYYIAMCHLMSDYIQYLFISKEHQVPVSSINFLINVLEYKIAKTNAAQATLFNKSLKQPPIEEKVTWSQSTYKNK
jgi:hypothetical protein